MEVDHVICKRQACKKSPLDCLLNCKHSVRCSVSSDADSDGKDDCLIIGKFVENRDKASRKNFPGHLSFQDETGCVPCVISTSGPLVLDKNIICLSWNFIRNAPDGSGYLEINKWILMKDDTSANAPVNVISSLSASWVLSHRSSVPVKQANIFGEIDFVTEIFMVHGDPVFIINLDGRVNILIKGNSFLHWQQLIVPGRKYVFINLRPTTLFKDKPNQRSVFVPWKGSIVQEHEYITYKILNLQEYCQNIGLKAVVDEMMDCEDSSQENAELITYQGVVTGLLDGEIILDKKAKFTVSFVNAVHKFEHIRPGCCVVFHNVHVIKTKQAEGVQFCCCLRSCVRIESFPSHFQLGKSYNSEKHQMWPLMNRYSLSFHEMKKFSWHYEELLHKLCPTFSRLTCDESMKILLKQFNLNNRKTRVFLDEVLAAGHVDCVVDAERKTGNWLIPCMNELDHIASLGTEAKEQNWCFSVIDSGNLKIPQVLIGWLRGNPVTGQLELCDQTGGIPCIISRHHSGRPHQCTLTDCSVPYKSLMLNPPGPCICPYPQTWWLGALLLLRDFHLIREVFSSGKQSETVSRTYILFSMTDVTVISTEKTSIGKLISFPNLELPIGPAGGCAGPVASSSGVQKFATSQLLLVIHKDNLVVRSRINDAAQLHFYAQACFIGDPCVYEVSGDGSLESEKDAEGGGDALSVRYVALLFTSKNVRWYHLLHHECTYRLINLNSNDVNAFKAKVKSRPLQKVLDKHAIEECLTVKDDALMVRVGNDCAAGDETPLIGKLHTLSKKERDWVHEARHQMWKSNHIPEINSIHEILQKRQRSFASELPLLSCEGVVKKKIYFNHDKIVRRAKHVHQNETLGVSAPGDPSLKLILADPDTGDTLEVVAQMTDMSCPLAVIPGTRVRFTKLEQKPAVSNFYCRITVASNLAITAFSDFAMSNEARGTLQDYNLNKLASVYLIDLMGPSCDTSLKLFHCLISKVFRLQLQLVCVGCSMSANDWHLAQECPTCGTCQMPHVKAYAVAQVDDGSYSARVSCSGDMVAQMLSLSATQWKDLQLLVQTEGSVEYSPFSFTNGERPVDKFVERLCQSDRVCRQVSVVAHRKFFKDSQNACSKRTIKVAGRALETYCLPIVHLEAVAFLPQDLGKVTNRLLSHLSV